jgi:hypothetical protein
MKKVAIMGMFRSGTNYTRTVMEWNFDVVVEYNTYGWKHGLFPILSSQCSIIVPNVPLLTISKHPLAALESLFRYYLTNGKNLRASKSFDSFLRNPIVIFDQSLLSSSELWFRNPIDYYNTLYLNLLSARSVVSSGTHIKYEDAIASPSLEFERISNILNLDRKAAGKIEPIIIPEHRTRNMGEGKKRSDPSVYVSTNVFSPDYYIKQEYRSAYSGADLLWVRSQINEELMEKLDYNMSWV